MANEVRIEGIEELIEKLDNMLDDAQIKAALGSACALVERSAKQKAIKGTGELRRSIKSKIVNTGGCYSGIVFTPLEYAPYVEFGTGLFAENGNGRKEVPWVYIEGGSGGGGSGKKTVYKDEADAIAAAEYLKEEKGLDARVTYGMKPQPFLRPALHENREEIKRILKGGILKDD
jgi:HK97 gp10 family phage protein